jgi:hypothetical protein
MGNRRGTAAVVFLGFLGLASAAASAAAAAATTKGAASGIAVEPSAPALVPTPDVDTVDAESDPDLDKAKPTGEPEQKPLDLGMKGRLGISLNTDPNLTTGLSFDWWTGERDSIRFTVSGSYLDSPSPTYNALPSNDGYGGSSTLNWSYGAEIAVRSAWFDLGDLGFVYSQVSLGGGQSQSWSQYQGLWDDRWAASGKYTLIYESDNEQTYGLFGLRLGAEVFWPGRRDLSFEASWGAALKWSQNSSNAQQTSSDPANEPAPARQSGTADGFQILTNSAGWTAAINFYFR